MPSKKFIKDHYKLFRLWTDWFSPTFRAQHFPGKALYSLKEFLFWEMQPGYCGKIWRLKRLWQENVLDWLTPFYSSGKKLIKFCANENGTKLLSYGALFFYTRTRDESQTYFYGEIKRGHLLITKTFYTKGAEGPHVNLFTETLVQREEDAPIKATTEKILDMPIWTKTQCRKALEEIIKIDMNWLQGEDLTVRWEEMSK